MTPTVSIDEGTIPTTVAPAAPAAPAADTKPAVKTLAEAEKEYRENFDKSHGRDLAKLFPNSAPAKKEEPKPEAKADAKPEDKPEVKTDPPATEKKKNTSGFAKTVNRLNRIIGQKDEQLRSFEERLNKIEKGAPAATPVKADEPKEPTRAQFNTDLEYFEAARAWDKAQLTKETDKKVETVVTGRDEEKAQQRWNAYVERKDAFLKDHPDYQEAIDKSPLEFSPVIVGLLIDKDSVSDPAFLYDMAMSHKEAKKLNDLNEEAIAAIGSAADSPTDVLRYLCKNPDDIKKFNGLDIPKKAKFVGIIESRVESAKAATAAITKPEEKKPEPTQAKPEVKTEAAPAAAAPSEPAMRRKPEPPPPITGGAAPSSTDWRDPKDMTLKERERLYYEDQRNRRR